MSPPPPAGRARPAPHGRLPADRVHRPAAWLTPVTEQWAVIAVQGPRSAAALAPFIAGIDLGAMPHMSVRDGHIGDIPIRLFRVGFTGELGSRSTCRPTTRSVFGTRCGRWCHACPTAPTRCMSCGPRKATSSSARKPTGRSRRTTSDWAGRSRTRAISWGALSSPADLARPNAATCGP